MQLKSDLPTFNDELSFFADPVSIHGQSVCGTLDIRSDKQITGWRSLDLGGMAAAPCSIQRVALPLSLVKDYTG